LLIGTKIVGDVSLSTYSFPLKSTSASLNVVVEEYSSFSEPKTLENVRT
jgi:hypothetical protein